MGKKTKLTIGQILQLEVEIAGSEEMKIKGLLRQSLSQVIKYHLTRLLRAIAPIKEDWIKTRDELIKEYGVLQEDGSYKIADPTEMNENLTEILGVEHEIEHHDFKIEDIEVDTDEFYPMMYTLIDNEQVQD